MRVLPPTYFISLLFLAIALHLNFTHLILVHYPLNLIGLIFIMFGIVINLWIDLLFKKNITTVKPHRIPTRLIISGPFRFSRHPMYLGMLSILLGTALFLGTWVTLLSPFIFMLLMELLFIPVEEKNLNIEFSNYSEYQKKVRRWI